MAAMSSISERSAAEMDSDEEFPASESYLALQLAKTPDNEMGELFRPSLAESQKIGFFSLDRATQTHDTEIIDMKQMTESVHELLEDADQMKRDIHFAQNVMQADFESRLQKKSIELYVRVNDKISELEKMHEDRVATVRRAFKQQLSDAITRIHTLYNEDADDNQHDLDQRVNREKRRKDNKAGKWENKVLDLQAKLQQNESVITMLKQQIAEYQEQEQERLQAAAEEIEEDEPVESRAPSTHVDEAQLELLREEVTSLEKKVHRMDRALQAKEEVTDDLNKEIAQLHNELERERIMVEQLNQEKEELQESSANSEAAVRRQMENQSLSMQKELEDRMRAAREEAFGEARNQMEDMQGGDRLKIKQLREEKKMLEQLLAQEKEKVPEKPQETLDLEKAKRNEQKLIAEIAKLKKEIERVHKTWEKKFAILQQSLHALKDESYLRQTMQRQAAQLHQASISFAYDAPLGISPNKSQAQEPSGGGPKRPLPDIGKGQTQNDYMSYTVSAPSGRATTLFSTDENQVMSDTEQELPDGMVPLPPPPNRSHTDCSEDASRQDAGASRSSNRSHVVVLPTVPAQ